MDLFSMYGGDDDEDGGSGGEIEITIHQNGNNLSIEGISSSKKRDKPDTEATIEFSSNSNNGEKRMKIGVDKCEVCKENVSKYKCPACFVLFCSAECSKQHRSESDCNGVKKKFLKLNNSRNNNNNQNNKNNNNNNSYHLILKRERSNLNQYYLLNVNQNVNNSLNLKEIIEYPTILVVFDLDKYNIIREDTEVLEKLQEEQKQIISNNLKAKFDPNLVNTLEESQQLLSGKPIVKKNNSSKSNANRNDTNNEDSNNSNNSKETIAKTDIQNEIKEESPVKSTVEEIKPEEPTTVSNKEIEEKEDDNEFFFTF
ncbi:hypothetical protein PPL_06864 [Heterostelium album PN500]|uniref:HIT-type domain-containing protein n=1 Tax=Heterostelium pallidum (strain ATCC 26659 / Pp 5 / PN500) TaxID=670386 RepID=D3BDR2_HETP5|nr:hypothetical protein PPL_06864 [Heterostelium album PN500]EFA80043.1 hypothetical protein PPL_06864 [Heterostelium album PN500]|eukprot:XP_020432163.1 hypothetical protein PPL_06864 [Heterostelium album PN500]